MPKPCLEGVDRAHLVGDRADAADAGDDVDDLVRRAADDEPLEVARRLEDLEVRLHDLAVADAQAQRAFALDAGEAGDVDREVAGRARHACRVSCIVQSSVRLERAPGGPPWASTTARNGAPRR